MHQALKVLFKIESTSKLSVDEFTDYINDIIVWAATEFSVPVKDPGDYGS